MAGSLVLKELEAAAAAMAKCSLQVYTAHSLVGISHALQLLPLCAALPAVQHGGLRLYLLKSCRPPQQAAAGQEGFKEQQDGASCLQATGRMLHDVEWQGIWLCHGLPQATAGGAFSRVGRRALLLRRASR